MRKRRGIPLGNPAPGQSTSILQSRLGKARQKRAAIYGVPEDFKAGVPQTVDAGARENTVRV